ncbi:MAG: hypothetical protein WC624_04935 [Candidatus Margulisiibacteriota bacterium]
MIEAMTEGTFKKKGLVFAPSEALDVDPVILKYVRQYPEKIERLLVFCGSSRQVWIICALRISSNW